MSEKFDLPADFGDVLEDEWKEIRLRRRFLRALRTYTGERASVSGAPHAGPAGAEPPRNLVGLALSGGGIRSATFSLGVLQGLRGAGLLPAFDYLSTVSGGGYLGGWWSGWLARDPLLVPADLNDPAGMLLALFPSGGESGLKGREALLDAIDSEDRHELAHLAERIGREGGGYGGVGIGDRQRIVEILNALLEQEALYDRGTGTFGPALRELASPALRNLVYELIGLHVEMDCTGRREQRERALPRLRQENRDDDAAAGDESWSCCEQVLLNRLFLEELLGGFLAGTTSAGRVIFPPEEGIEPDRYDAFLPPPPPPVPAAGASESGRAHRSHADDPPRGGRNDDSASAWFDPIHHLRLFANYLTPRKGALSGDTWRAIAVVSRNLVLTWLVLLPIFVALMLCGQLYFLWNAATTDHFLPPVRPAVARTVAAMAGGAAASGAAGGMSGRSLPRADAVTARRMADSTAEKIKHTVSSRPVLLARLAAAAQPVIPIFGWIVVVVIAWIICGQDTSSLRGKVMPWVELCVVVLLVSALLWVFGSEITSGLRRGAEEDRSLLDILSWWWSGWWPPLVWALGGAALLATGLRTGRAAGDYPEGISRRAMGQLKREVRRNQLVRLHSTLLVVAVGLSAVLLFAGFGHEAVNYLFYATEPRSALADYVKEIGGWGALLLTLGGTIYTLMKASPAGGGDHAKVGEASKTGTFVLAITPPLLVLLLALLSAWWGHGVVARLVPDANSVAEFIHRNRPFHYITFVGIFLGLLFAWYEMSFVGGTWPRLRVLSYEIPKRYVGHLLMLLALLLLALLVSKGIWSISTGEFYTPLSADPDRLFWDWYDWLLPHMLMGSHPAPRVVSLAIALLAAVTLVVRLRFIRVPRSVSGGLNRFVKRGGASGGMRDPASYRTGLEVAGMAVVTFLILAVILLWLLPLGMSLRSGIAPVLWLQEEATRHLTAYILFGFGFCILFLAVELFFGDGLNYRSFGLLGGIIAALVVLLQFSYIPWNAPAGIIAEGRSGTVNLWLYRVHAAFGLITTLLTWAIAIGWTVDPNMLSLHSFYKARLTRAYLGASNRRRRRTQRRITEAVVGDDLPLAELRNCRRGAPYHIVNATLNLVGGRDLSTAQRSAANFILTQNYCGSPRTGYRPTSDYMRGGLTLGTAVSISGAAASPNMGTKTPTAALAMLMTLFNVRLGYWAPTPNSEGWHFGQARLWPFYTLREFLSQTHDLSSFCYLTDGGHFDNTGLYALVERGCRYIVLVDCGADPSPCFADLGDAIRRCRIDFGTEFDLDLSPAIPSGEGGRRSTEGHYLAGTVTYSPAHLRRLHRAGTGEEDAADRIGYIIVVKPMRGGNETVDVRQYGFENGDFPQQTTADQWFDESQFESYRKLGELSVRQMVARASENALLRRSQGDPYSEPEPDAADALYRLRRGALPTSEDIRLIFGEMVKMKGTQ